MGDDRKFMQVANLEMAVLQEATGNQGGQRHQVGNVVTQVSQSYGPFRLDGNNVTQGMFLALENLHFEAVPDNFLCAFLSHGHTFGRGFTA